jgi:hypothetical protein
MPMTLNQIVEEARHLPTEQVMELVDRLSEALHISPGIEESWKAETRRRVADIEVSARIRKVVGRSPAQRQVQAGAPKSKFLSVFCAGTGRPPPGAGNCGPAASSASFGAMPCRQTNLRP